MPELPEVEVTRRRLELELVGRRIEGVEIRTAKLRLPIPAELAVNVTGRKLRSIERKGKYLLFDCETGYLLIHLGMTGFLQLLSGTPVAGKHDHLDIRFEGGRLLRFHDPRKFGTVLWITGNPLQHPLLVDIGPEPLSDVFNAAYLYGISRNRRVPVKQFLMDSSIVAGVGNIYANEALFRSRVRPDRAVNALTEDECQLIVSEVRNVLMSSISAGSSYQVSEEMVSYYPLRYAVYGRGGESCRVCGTVLDEIRLANRSSVYCRSCQV